MLQQSEKRFTSQESDRIIEMAWEDRTPFYAIELQFGLTENELKTWMRSQLKPSSFRLWRKRVKGRLTKTGFEKTNTGFRFKSKMQKTITGNKISKR